MPLSPPLFPPSSPSPSPSPPPTTTTEPCLSLPSTTLIPVPISLQPTPT